MKKIFLCSIASLLLLVGCSKNNIEETSYIPNNEEVIENTTIPKDKIFAFIDTNNSWAIDPTIPEEVIKDSSSVVKIKVLSTENAEFIDTIDSYEPFTPINIEITDILSGENLSGEMKIYSLGGDVLISDAINNLPETDAKKMGFTELSNEEQNSKYISYTSEYDYDFEVGKEYVVILDKHPNNIYSIAAYGYGIFESAGKSSKELAPSKSNSLSLQSSEPIYKNVLTGVELNLED